RVPGQAVPAHAGSLARPRPAPRGASLEAVMTGEAKDLQVLLSIVTAHQDRELVVDLKHPLGGRSAADLAGAAAPGDERFPPGLRHRRRTAAAVVREQDALARPALAHVRSPVAGPVGGARTAEDDQVGGRARRFLVELEDIECPAPFDRAVLASAGA